MKEHDFRIGQHDGSTASLSAPCVEEIDPRNVAAALSQINRFTGHTLRSWSVAAHSVLVTYLVRSPRLKAAAALHDGHESLITDQSTIFKQFMRSQGAGEIYDRVENAIDAAIFARFGVDYPLSSADKAEIKRADMQAFAIERYMLTRRRDRWSNEPGTEILLSGCSLVMELAGKPEASRRALLEVFSEIYCGRIPQIAPQRFDAADVESFRWEIAEEDRLRFAEFDEVFDEVFDEKPGLATATPDEADAFELSFSV